MFKKIVLAFKFSQACRAVLEKALQLSIEQDAELLIFHALDYRLNVDEKQNSTSSIINQEMKEKFETELKPHLDDFPKVKFDYLPTDPGMEICKIARRTKADLILVGCHERPGKQSISRLDYVGITIFENAPCPVMLVPP